VLPRLAQVATFAGPFSGVVALTVILAANVPGAYTGAVRNRDSIGLDDNGYKALWDADH